MTYLYLIKNKISEENRKALINDPLKISVFFLCLVIKVYTAISYES